MTEQTAKVQEKKKGFFARLLERIDKKMEAKAKSAPCCNPSSKDKGTSCC
jgi:hypothetical protein